MTTIPILIAGPTASGKSSLGIRVAERFGGVIVNADAMQVYGDLAILTARPSETDTMRVPHALYGHVDGAEAYSVASWLAAARDVLAKVQAAGKRPVILGGSGLYFDALLKGLSPVPSVPAEIRRKWRALADRDRSALHPALSERDPVMAERLSPSDTQRLTRALEVVDATGQSLASWQEARSGSSLTAFAAPVCVVMTPDRTLLREGIEARFQAMMAAGASDEVARLTRRGLDPSLPVMKALGVRDIAAYNAGSLDRTAAVDAAVQRTRQYAKRQETYFRNQFHDWRRAETVEAAIEHIL